MFVNNEEKSKQQPTRVSFIFFIFHVYNFFFFFFWIAFNFYIINFLVYSSDVKGKRSSKGKKSKLNRMMMMLIMRWKYNKIKYYFQLFGEYSFLSSLVYNSNWKFRIVSNHLFRFPQRKWMKLLSVKETDPNQLWQIAMLFVINVNVYQFVSWFVFL
jgi:hypothetical protein